MPSVGKEKNDVHLLCERNQTPATPDQNRPKTPRTLPRGPFIGTCLGGPRKAGYRYLERMSRACVHTSSLAPRHLCHVFVISRLLIRHQMGYFQGFHPHPCQCCVESPFYAFICFGFLLWGECCATDVKLERKHLKAKGRIFGCPV